MSEKSKTQIDIRIFKDRDPDIFELLINTEKPMKLIREIFSDWSILKQENDKLLARVEQTEKDLIGIKLSSRQAQKNTDALLGIANILLFENEHKLPFTPLEKRHPFLAYFETKHKEMLDTIAQKKVYNDKAKQKELTKSDTSFLDESPF